MYQIHYTQLAYKQLSKLPKVAYSRIVLSLERLKFRPHSFVKRLAGREEYSFRVGDYRVLLDIFDDKLVILVVEVGHRKNIYDR